MNIQKDFLIPFVGLKLGKHQFDYQIDKKFFEGFEFDEYNDANIKVELVFDKKSTLLELAFKHKGTINVPCDLTGEDFDLPIKGKLNLIVKFGDAFNNENDELLILPHGEFQVDVAQYIYEMIVLSVPSKRIHPGVKDGTLKTEAIEKLNELAPKEQHKEEENIDPRWDKLKQLLTDK
ncbi:hypothetical protein FSS13T_25060 [Flavobacterium saliperosum S13]|uniref:Uncharacterized metal-binding protein YceD, DUF177 family n=2 Tax=Flavobacterium saliperosum TaxID=329186 RepID=A0A1G4W6F1_9FLAO|nr:DUF177 domain-containing protein [Flavobacterium saliperosum]ESU23055.1 hypothetical protein FSS13T_25060 [Flavobacterium saliperosum S13]SCX17495.1 Uncharacterized metal-binding protein YceD, DUF177 family [Flavobacterium saliperosum]